MGFADQLVAYAKEAHLELVATPELEEAITDFLRRARAPWPDIDISDETVLRHVGARMGATDDPVGKLNALHAADLYLACACSRAHVRAIAAFERLYVSQISAYLFAVRRTAGSEMKTVPFGCDERAVRAGELHRSGCAGDARRALRSGTDQPDDFFLRHEDLADHVVFGVRNEDVVLEIDSDVFGWA